MNTYLYVYTGMYKEKHFIFSPFKHIVNLILPCDYISNLKVLLILKILETYTCGFSYAPSIDTCTYIN